MAVSPREVQPRPGRRARALSDPTRIALLELLGEGARPVSDLARSLGVPPDRLYHHLDVLEQSGLVQLRQLSPRRLYEAIPFCGLDASEVLGESDRLELIAAVFDLARLEAESAHRRSDPLEVLVQSIYLTSRQRSALAAEINAVIERWSGKRRSRGARRTRVIFGAIPQALDLTLADAEDTKRKGGATA